MREAGGDGDGWQTFCYQLHVQLELGAEIPTACQDLDDWLEYVPLMKVPKRRPSFLLLDR